MEPKQGTHTCTPAVKILKLMVCIITTLIQGLKLGASFEALHHSTRKVDIAVNTETNKKNREKYIPLLRD
jgi:hypothetical protein